MTTPKDPFNEWLSHQELATTEQMDWYRKGWEAGRQSGMAEVLAKWPSDEEIGRFIESNPYLARVSMMVTISYIKQRMGL